MKIIQVVTILFIELFLCISNTYADDVATKLNRDWKNINRTGCKLGDPDYYCSGVIAHVFDNESFLHASNNYPWMPSDAAKTKGSVSFSYLRQDIPVDPPLYTGSNIAAGYIFAPMKDLTSLQQFTLLCDYPINGKTDDRTAKGCGDRSFNNNSTDLSTCGSIGVNTSDEYVQHIIRERDTLCSASPDQAGFNMVLDTIKKLKAGGPYPFMINWNELVIQEWTDKENKDVPIEAFFYEIINNSPDENGKKAADYAAQLYHQVTGIDVPVVAVDVKKLATGDDAPFSNETL